MIKKIFTPTAITIWLMASIGVVALIPYLMALMPGVLENVAEQAGVPLQTIIIAQIVQGSILSLVLTLIGLSFSKRLGLGAHIIDAIFHKTSIPFDLRSTIKIAILSGLACGLLLRLLDSFVFISLIPELSALEQITPVWWKGLLASLYGGVTEEVMMRLFLLSVLAIIIRLLSGDKSSKLPTVVFWIANILAAILFAIGHLPAIAEIMDLTPLVILRVLVLNSIAGIIAGVFFWKRSLEIAMIFHFSADIMLHVLLPLIL